MTLPSLSWAVALKRTKVELELLTDPEAYLMVECGMRGGIATISNRHAVVANNPQVAGLDPSMPTSYITYLDANNLYGYAMSEPLPVGDFRFLDQDEIQRFRLHEIAADSDNGYIIECDLAYRDHLHEEHNDYPMAAEHLGLYSRKGVRPMSHVRRSQIDFATSHLIHETDRWCDGRKCGRKLRQNLRHTVRCRTFIRCCHVLLVLLIYLIF